MGVLFGCPTPNPNSQHVALAYFEAGWLECFCVPWMPSAMTLRVLSCVRPLRSMVQRLERRHFQPLAGVPKVQGRIGEFYRLVRRASGFDNGLLSDQHDRWLMRVMARECRRLPVTAVHAYEGSAHWPFLAAKRGTKACVYDLPACYYQGLEPTLVQLEQKYSDWINPGQVLAGYNMRRAQKQQEMELADLVLVASSYVERTVREFYPYKEIARTPYGVDVEFWTPGPSNTQAGPLRYIYAGNISVRKGIPLLIEAWSKAGLHDAELTLVGSWALPESKLRSLPAGITWIPPCSPQFLRDRYRESHVFVFPSHSDGFGLVLLEAMACGLPSIASEASIGPEIITPDCGFITPTGDLDRLVELLRWFDRYRNELPGMGRQARAQAARYTWRNYRSSVIRAVSKLV
jgi:alpha-maltose-1-phosphate synthase